ncbi:MAG: SH3 domain-containing protein [Spirochaetales bacterium]|nr:SH3 domain-containing protein [Spirochaetales bacterium]
MKKLLPCIMLLIVLSGVTAAAQSGKMSIIVKETQAREKPSYLGKILAVLTYGEMVDTVSLEKDWYRVRLSGGREGWVHSSALTKKKIVLKAGKTDTEKYADSDDVVLAGKGFNEQVEKQYRKEKDLDFSEVDRMEKIVVTPGQMEEFLGAGGLEGVEGGV